MAHSTVDPLKPSEIQRANATIEYAPLEKENLELRRALSEKKNKIEALEGQLEEIRSELSICRRKNEILQSKVSFLELEQSRAPGGQGDIQDREGS